MHIDTCELGARRTATAVGDFDVTHMIGEAQRPSRIPIWF